MIHDFWYLELPPGYVGVKGPAGLVAWQKAVWWSLVAIRNIAQQASKRQRLGRMVQNLENPLGRCEVEVG